MNTLVTAVVNFPIMQCVIGFVALNAILASAAITMVRLRRIHIRNLCCSTGYHLFDYIIKMGRAVTVHRTIPYEPIETTALSCHWDDNTSKQYILELGRYAARLPPDTGIYWNNNFEVISESKFKPGNEIITAAVLTASDFNNKAKIIYLNSKTLQSTSAQKVFEFGFYLDPKIEVKIV